MNYEIRTGDAIRNSLPENKPNSDASRKWGSMKFDFLDALRSAKGDLSYRQFWIAVMLLQNAERRKDGTASARMHHQKIIDGLPEPISRVTLWRDLKHICREDGGLFHREAASEYVLRWERIAVVKEGDVSPAMKHHPDVSPAMKRPPCFTSYETSMFHHAETSNKTPPPKKKKVLSLEERADKMSALVRSNSDRKKLSVKEWIDSDIETEFAYEQGCSRERIPEIAQDFTAYFCDCAPRSGEWWSGQWRKWVRAERHKTTAGPADEQETERPKRERKKKLPVFMEYENGETPRICGLCSNEAVKRGFDYAEACERWAVFHRACFSQLAEIGRNIYSEKWCLDAWRQFLDRDPIAEPIVVEPEPIEVADSDADPEQQELLSVIEGGGEEHAAAAPAAREVEQSDSRDELIAQHEARVKAEQEEDRQWRERQRARKTFS